MDFSYQGLFFGDFSGLPDDEKYRICEVMRPKKGDRAGVELPFDETCLGNSSTDVIFSDEAGHSLSLAEMEKLNVHAQEFVPVPSAETATKPVDFEQVDHTSRNRYVMGQTEHQEHSLRPPPGYGALPPGGAFQQQNDVVFMGDPMPGHDSGQSTESEQSAKSRDATTKSYERRNKKKRPPGYYNQLECYRTKEDSLQVDGKVPSDLLASAQNRSNSLGHVGSNVCSQQNVYPQKSLSHVHSSDSVTIDIEMDDDSVYSNETTNLEFGVSNMTIENSHFDPRSRTEQPMATDVNRFSTDDKCIFASDVTMEPEQVIENNVHKMVPHRSDNIQNIEKSSKETIQTGPVDWFDADGNIPVSKPETTQIQTKPHETEVADFHRKISESENSVLSAEVKETSPSPVAEPAAMPVPAAKPTSWASLFKNTTPSQPARGPMPFVSQANPEDRAREAQKEKLEKIETVSLEDDKTAKHIGNQLLDIQLSHRPASLQPRGLINRGNWCYVNATLQALLACPPFFNLLKSLSAIKEKLRGPSSTPITDSLLVFVNEFSFMKFPGMKNPGKRDRIQDISPGIPFEPSYVYKMLTKIKSTDAFKQGKQEDAEEFLSCVLNGIHDEMVAVMDLAKGKPAQEKAGEANHEESNGYVNDNESSEEDDEWKQVGPKKKSVVTRVADFSKSPVSNIFCGQIRSVLHQSGSRESATLEPFFTLPLDIQSEKVWTVKDALDGFVSRESLQGFTCSKTKVEIEATRRIMLEVLPPVLILHLKCFVYNKDGGIQKVIKKIDYGIDLEVNKDLLSTNLKGKVSNQQRSYKLFAVIYHLGKHAAGGHYTVDIYHNGINGWIRIDDGMVKVIPVGQVLKFTAPKVPYLLYYRRCDLLSA
ncbi:ubiquitin carboxyl-terminal hydrolase 10-like isoform X2 [Lineus longissimus]|uniref:ubiquitin carboxyl-terminal hydrolase 10-like isoform X2 n=1 Tax=Lineus longissimus TaxID=88925 RepID=UPI002B4DFF78